MRIRLKGINRTRKLLADGRIIYYYYAWKGGPALRGSPGSPEFVASYNEAVVQKKAPASGVILGLLQKYQASEDFRGLAPRSQSDYKAKIKLIESKFGDFPIAALPDRKTRGEFLCWRDELAQKSRRQADYTWSVLALVLAWAHDRGFTAANPCVRGGRLYRSMRADKIWTDSDEAAFLGIAPPHLHLPLLLALWTGQRQGDLLRLPWSAYDGRHIRLKQSKSGRRVIIPVGLPLRTMLERTQKVSPLILVNSEGKPWTSGGFSASWRKARAKAGVVDLTFHDLRGTAVTRLAIAGCTEPEIATITGHSLREVASILDANYLSRNQALAESAISKLEKGTKTPN